MMLSFLLTLTHSQPEHNETTLVFENHGTILKPQGLVALDSNQHHISIFYKFKLPKINSIAKCDSQWKINSYIEEANSHIVNTTVEYLNMYKSFRDPEQSFRTKRSLLAGISLGIGAFDLLVTGLSYKSLYSHISNVDHKLNNFMQEQHTFDQKLLQIDENIIHIVDSMKLNIDAKFAELTCGVQSATGKIYADQLTFQWTQKLKELFQSTLSGKLTVPLTPSIIPPSDIVQITKDHKILKSSHYLNNPYSIYQISKLTTFNMHALAHHTAAKQLRHEH